MDTRTQSQQDISPEIRVLRLGVVPYLNMAPLIDRLEDVRIASAPAGRLCLVAAPPSRLAAMMDAGEIDVGMVPVGALLERPEWRIVGRTMIGSRGPVRSVLALSLDPPERWRVCRPDAQSRSSNALFRVLAQRRMGLRLDYDEPLPSDAELRPRDARPGEVLVIIGSRANQARDEWIAAGGHVMDMGEAWFEWTGLPFAFALWAARAGLDPAETRVSEWMSAIDAHGRSNMERIDEIIARWPDRTLEGQSPEQARDYLTRRIRHELTTEYLAGLRRFHEEGRGIGMFAADWSLDKVNATGLSPIRSGPDPSV